MSLASGKTYRGINIFTLSCIASVYGFESNRWLTFKQAKEQGGSVKKGSKGTPVVFWKLWQKEKEELVKEEESRTIPILRYYTVFNAEQCEGIDYPKPLEATPTITFEPLERCEAVYNEMPNPPGLKLQGFQPYYSMKRDEVYVHKPEYHDSVEDYFCTQFHELVHSTASEKRLNRHIGKRYGSPQYAKEELIAEMGSAFLCGHCGIEKPIIANAAAYIQGWMKSLKHDPRMVVLAGAQAQKAADYILNIKHAAEPERD